MCKYWRKYPLALDHSLSKEDLLSSLVKKRRENRVSKRPNLVLDAVCNCTVARLRTEISFQKLRSVMDTSRCSSFQRKRNIPLSNASRITKTDERDIDKMLGMDSFFEKLKNTSIKKKRMDPPEVSLCDDPMLNDFVLKFIETGTMPEQDLCDTEISSWAERDAFEVDFVAHCRKRSLSRELQFHFVGDEFIPHPDWTKVTFKGSLNVAMNFIANKHKSSWSAGCFDDLLA